MEYIQFTLTVNEGKWLIAHAITGMPEVRRAMAEGRVVFKAGTTVSCVAQLLTNTPLRICGRITPRGTVSSRAKGPGSHFLLYDQGRLENLDGHADVALLELGPGDVMITGANIIDAFGGAAMLAGSPGGNDGGRTIATMCSEGFQVIVAAGLEKLIPGAVGQSIIHSRRKGISSSRGMACGLFPVMGQVITELEAIRMIADVEVCLIGRGGINGAEGGSVFQAWGPEVELEELERVLASCRGLLVAGELASLEECSYPCVNCNGHCSCCYKDIRQRKPQNCPSDAECLS